MTEHPDLDARVRTALQGAAPDIDATDGARSTLLRGMARHRARRQRLLALSAAVVIVAGGVGAAIAVAQPSSTPNNLAAPHVRAAAPTRPELLSAPPPANCPSLALGTQRSVCAGSIEGPVPIESAASGTSGGASSSASNGAVASTTTAPTAAGIPSQGFTGVAPGTATVATPVRVGQIFTVTLPAAAPAHWLVPTELVVHGPQGSLYRLGVDQNSTTGSLVVRYKVRTPGAIDLQSSAVEACPKGQPATCTTTVTTWSLDLVASPRR